MTATVAGRFLATPRPGGPSIVTRYIPAGSPSADHKAEIAAAVTKVHTSVTGAPARYVNVAFFEMPPGNLYVGELGNKLRRHQVRALLSRPFERLAAAPQRLCWNGRQLSCRLQLSCRRELSCRRYLTVTVPFIPAASWPSTEQ